MAGLTTTISIDFNRRLCSVKGEIGYFHCWGGYSESVPAGASAALFGIVEFNDRVERVWPEDIKFCDEINQTLQIFKNKEGENGAKEN